MQKINTTQRLNLSKRSHFSPDRGDHSLRDAGLNQGSRPEIDFWKNAFNMLI